MSDYTTDSQEISISDIFRRLWRNRGLILVVPFLTVGAAVLYLALTATNAERPVNYLINLQNIENQRYPSGAAFAPQDLLIPQVLSELRRRVDLPAEGNLRRALTVTYDSPIAEGVARAYRDRIAGRNLTQAEITAINAEYQQELRNAMQSSVRITVNHRALGVEPATGVQVARLLPEVWSDVYSSQFRIFSDTRLADMSIRQDFEDLDSTASILTSSTRLAAMERGLDILIRDNRLSALQTPDGRTPAELRDELQRFQSIYFNPVRATGFRNEDAVSGAYLANLRLSIADLRRRMSAYDQALADLRTYQRSTQIVPPASDAGTPVDGGSLQVGETGFAELVRLAQQASSSAFLEELLRRRNDLAFEISGMTKELDGATYQLEQTTLDDFRENVANSMQELVERYSSLVGAARQQLQERGGVLYEPALGPVVGGSRFPPNSILIVAAAGLAGGLVAVVVALLLGSANPRRRDQEEA